MTSNTRSCSDRGVERTELGDLIRDHVAPLGAVLAELSPADIPLPWAEDVMDAFAAVQRIGEAGVLMMQARVVEHGRWRREGAASPADWLADKHGTTTGKAKADLKTSERLADLPGTAGEVRAGNLSADQAGAVADGASVNPAAEDDLIDTAKSDSVKHTREEAARRKAELESEASKRARERRAHRERKARWWNKNGEWHLFAKGPLVQGAELQQALENRVGEIHRERRATGEREGRDQYAFDALVDLMLGEPEPATEAETETGPGDSDGAGETGATPSSAAEGPRPNRARRRARRTREPVKRLMLVRVDLAALIRGHVSEGEVCEIPGVEGQISVQAARDLFGDAVLRLITTNGDAVVDVVNPKRQLTVAQQIAKLWTDPKCCVAGCNRTVRLEYEHRTGYAVTRQTVLVDIDHMCKHHHDLKTHHGWQLVDGTGRRAFVPPDDPRHPDHTAAPAADAPRQHPAYRSPTPSGDGWPELPSPAAASPEPVVDAARPPDDTFTRLRRLRADAKRRAERHDGQGDLFDDTG